MKNQNYLNRYYLNGAARCRSILLLILLSCITANTYSQSKKGISDYRSGTLEIKMIRPGVYLHISFLNTQQWGKVACNGMVYINQGEAIIFDSPTGDTASRELISLLQKKMKVKIRGIVVNHFHDDCLGGLKIFHQAGIPSYSSVLTQELARKTGATIPQHGFTENLELKAGNNTVINRYFGEAHTRDNIVSYLPAEQVLFGGCMVKALNASTGYLGDANVNEWSATVSRVKSAYPDIKYVIPGHDDFGDVSLLDYTIELFKPKPASAKTYTPVSQELFDTIANLDSLMFDAFNRRDLNNAMQFFDEDLEFYHDKGGVDNYSVTRNKLQSLFTNNAGTGLRRVLVPGSLEVYPIANYGAVQTNLHQFCHMENGKNDCGTFKNIMIWQKKGNQWKVTRVISYDH
ncbi:hypothetical protein BC349_18230 [Flavihumibacter stibioxidans]|uniref:beta-lactamase n=1 Tax=Flavihumibacter stibioxidans TaxID=1834163 RepID=A0ABR7MEJ3_9BACT|nr:hypothetical protein [Flavihumibacter stibioxidans]